MGPGPDGPEPGEKQQVPAVNILDQSAAADALAVAKTTAEPAGDDDIEAVRAERDRLAVQLEAAGQPVGGPGPAGPKVRMKVESPHESLTFGMVTVGTEFTDVPEAMAARLRAAAERSGVTITQEA
jgi:hypothetical protein